MKHLKFIAMWFFGATILFTSCKKDEEVEETPTPTPAPGTVIVSSNITTNTTWSAGTIYQLGGRITVTAGATLTIEPGTIIKGEAGTGANATALLVARGGKLNANGTASSPIIFTSVADEIDYTDLAAGNMASPNLDPTVNGLWGGVIILGRAPISASSNEIQIEGIPTSDANGLYGGSDPADNSGTIKYISIRHGGANIGDGNEINGLTLGGVGNGTIIENVEVISNQDDGIEWFGGTVNVTNAVVWNCGDDAIDTDQAWSGTLDNFVVVSALGHSFELDGPEGSLSAGHTITNGSIIATYGSNACIDLINVDNNSIVALSNLFFTGITATTQRLNNVNAAGVTFNNILFNVPSENLANHINGNGAVPAGISAGATPQANINQLNWTWTYESGAMDGL
jgi:hypothetical protein